MMRGRLLVSGLRVANRSFFSSPVLFSEGGLRKVSPRNECQTTVDDTQSSDHTSLSTSIFQKIMKALLSISLRTT